MPEPRETFYSTAIQMQINHSETLPFGTYGTTDGLPLRSGLPFRLFWIEGMNQHEGMVPAAVAGDFEALAESPDGPLVRMHSACTFSEIGDNPHALRLMPDVVGSYSGGLFSVRGSSSECECKPQRVASQARIASEGGIFFDLVEQEGRGHGLEIKREIYRLHREEGLDTADACERLGLPFDVRQYGHCARFLLENGLEKVRLLSNNPRKIDALKAAGIEVVPVPLIVGITEENISYVRTKRDRAGHTFPDDIELGS